MEVESLNGQTTMTFTYWLIVTYRLSVVESDNS